MVSNSVNPHELSINTFEINNTFEYLFFQFHFPAFYTLLNPEMINIALDFVFISSLLLF